MINSLYSKIVIETDEPEMFKKVLDEETRNRSETKIKTLGKKVIIETQAKDIVALKATTNQYLKVLETMKNALSIK